MNNIIKALGYSGSDLNLNTGKIKVYYNENNTNELEIHVGQYYYSLLTCEKLLCAIDNSKCRQLNTDVIFESRLSFNLFE